MAKTGRPDKLTPEREARIIGAIQQVGITQEEAASLAGIGERTFYTWKRKAREAAKLIPSDWKDKGVKQLMEWLDDLGIDRSEVVASGKGGRALKVDLISAIRERCGKYRDFFDKLDRAMLEGELGTVAELRAIGQGGRWRTDAEGVRYWEEIRGVREYQEPDGKGGWKTVRRVLVSPGPSESALRFILERRYNRFNPRKAIDTTASSADPHQLAGRLQRALAELEETVPEAGEG